MEEMELNHRQRGFIETMLEDDSENGLDKPEYLAGVLMDVFEELNGTYFYHGHTNVSAGELFNLIVLENFADSFGLDVASAAMILIGQPYIPVSGKLASYAKSRFELKALLYPPAP